jgi:hypothetical protein
MAYRLMIDLSACERVRGSAREKYVRGWPVENISVIYYAIEIFHQIALQPSFRALRFIHR